MIYLFKAAWLPALAFMVSQAVWAQEVAPKMAADPPSSQVPAPPIVYQSTFTQYQPWTDEPVQSWREANDQVGRIGGWRAYAKEIQAGEPAKGKPPVQPPSRLKKIVSYF